MIKEKVLYSLKDINIIPTPLTTIQSRSECICKGPSIEGHSIDHSYLPLIAAPMSCVLYDTNYLEFDNAGINTVIPRTYPFEKRLELFRYRFCAFSLKEAEELCKTYSFIDSGYICLDMANGHMKAQIDMGRKLRETLKGAYPGALRIMGGNIANPETYKYYDEAGFDYLRVSVGSGNGCLSSTQTAIHFPLASLLDEINELRKRLKKKKLGGNCKVIADGGMQGYSDIIKALALGADYVMAGLLFSKAATGEEKVGDKIEYYGMSTKRAQKEMGNTTLKTSEGKFLNLTKEYTLLGWVENFDSYLRSAMSYCDSRSLEEFREKSVKQVVSEETIKNVNNK